jgi:hypothetical protein
MSTTVVRLDDELLDVVEGLKGSGSHDAAEAILGRYLAPALPHVHAVRILCELQDATTATLKDAGGCLWLHPTPEQREGFSFIAGDKTLPKSIRTLGTVALKLADKVYWEDTHALGLRSCVWQAKVALKEKQEKGTHDDQI